MCQWRRTEQTGYRHRALAAATTLALIASTLAGCGESVKDASLTSAHTTEPSNDQPLIHCDFDAQGIADLGYVQPGSSHELTYALKAPNDRALSAIHIKSACPCVTAIDVPGQILAGQTGALLIRFEPLDKILHYQQDLLVYAADQSKNVRDDVSSTLKARLSIDARVGLPLRAYPEVLQIQQGQSIPGSVTLQNEGPTPVKLIYVLSNNPAIKASVQTDPIEPGGNATVQITASEAWGSESSAQLRIKTTHDKQPEVFVRVLPLE